MCIRDRVLAAAYLALNPPRVDRDGHPPRPVMHRFEWLAPVLVVIGAFAAFLVAQATVIFGGHDYLRRTTGLTYAEYVHQGFGQLTVATALTLLVIWAAARKAPRATPADRAWLRASLGLLCLQTLVVVASALHRMHVYEQAQERPDERAQQRGSLPQASEHGESAAEPQQAPESGEGPGQTGQHEAWQRAAAGHAAHAERRTCQQAEHDDPVGVPHDSGCREEDAQRGAGEGERVAPVSARGEHDPAGLSLIHISEPTRPY